VMRRGGARGGAFATFVFELSRACGHRNRTKK
jgi:hypothetical protein